MLFEVLKEAGLTVKRKKCSFGRVKLEFLGHVIGGGVINVPEARVKAIREHPLPRTRKQLRAFLGLIGFYRKFIKEYHRWSSALTPSTSRNAAGVVEWTSQMMEAFRGLRDQLSSSVCLIVPCVSDVFVVESDASATGIGAVLSVRRNDELLPVAFFSRQLKGTQCRYSAQELDGLALYESIRHFGFSGITWSFPGLYWTSKEKSRIVRSHRHRREFRLVEIMSAFRALWSVTTLKCFPIK